MNFYKLNSPASHYRNQDPDHHQHPQWHCHAPPVSVGHHFSVFHHHRLLEPGIGFYISEIAQNALSCLFSFLHIMCVKVFHVIV
jgi:hypothetical protein